MIKQTLFVFSCTAVLLFLAGCDLTGKVERGLERELPDVIGPAERYNVEIEGLRARTGRARYVTAVGERVRLENAPVLDQLTLELWNVKYNRRQERLEQVDSTRATVYLTPDDLELFLEENRNVEDASITLDEPDQATIRVHPSFGGIAIPKGWTVAATGQLVSRGDQIDFVLTESRAAGANLGDAITRRLSRAINPLVDLSQSPADLRITDVRVENGMVLLEATGDPTAISR